MQKELGLDSDMYQWLVNIFYIAYIVAQFAVILWKLFPPHIVGATVVLGWGLMAPSSQALIHGAVWWH